MKRATLMNFFLASSLLALGAAGCKKNPKNITTIPNSRFGTPSTDGPRDPFPPGTNGVRVPFDPTQGTTLKDPGAIGEPNLDANEDRSALAPQSIFFAFDSSSLKTSEQPKLDQVATYMKSAAAGVQLRIEGNCDERGTEEYNRSLGERRAISARDYLIQKHGIESGRITTMSNGEDRPKSLEKTEEAYAQNRRDDFVVLLPK